MKTELRQGQTCDSRSSDAERVDERYAEAGEAKEGGVERGQRMWQKKHRIRIPIIVSNSLIVVIVAINQFQRHKLYRTTSTTTRSCNY